MGIWDSRSVTINGAEFKTITGNPYTVIGINNQSFEDGPQRRWNVWNDFKLPISQGDVAFAVDNVNILEIDSIRLPSMMIGVDFESTSYAASTLNQLRVSGSAYYSRCENVNYSNRPDAKPLNRLSLQTAGFAPYTNIVAVPYIKCGTKFTGNVATTVSVQEYFANHSNKPVMQIFYKLYIGTTNKQHVTNVGTGFNIGIKYPKILSDTATEDASNQTIYNDYITLPWQSSGQGTITGFAGIAYNGVANITPKQTNYYTGNNFCDILYNTADFFTNVLVDSKYFIRFINNLDKDKLIKIMSRAGFIFCLDEQYVNDPLDSENIYIPVGDVPNGATHGAENLKNNRKDWGGESNYTTEPDPNTYDNETDLTTPTLTPNSCFNRSYAINYTGVKTFSEWLWNADDTVFEEIVKGIALLGANPIDGIVDLRLYPFDVARITGASQIEQITFGRTASPVPGVVLGNSDSVVVDLGSCTFHKHFKNFLDDEPYTLAVLYVPYCGTISIPTAVFMGHKISVKMIVDIITGACCAVVFCDDSAVYYMNGVCGVSIPVTGNNSAQYAANILNSVTSVLAGAAGSATEIATGNLIGGATGVAKTLTNAITTPINAVQYTHASAASPSCGLYYPQYPYFMIHRPIPEIPENYGHTVGYACSKSGLLSDFTGFTVAVNPDIDTIACTETEKEEITNLLTGGVYL